MTFSQRAGVTGTSARRVMIALAVCVGLLSFFIGQFFGHHPALRESLRRQRELKDGFPSRRQSTQLFDGSKSSRGADRDISDRVRRRGFVVCRLQLARIRAPWGFASVAER